MLYNWKTKLINLKFSSFKTSAMMCAIIGNSCLKCIYCMKQTNSSNNCIKMSSTACYYYSIGYEAKAMPVVPLLILPRRKKN